MTEKEGPLRKKRFLAGVSPWLILGAAAVLLPLFVFIALEDIGRQREQTTKLLVEKGAALIRSFEAGARTGLGMDWGLFQLQKLLMETSQQPGIDYFIVTDDRGRILADSDPSMIGEIYGTELDLEKIAAEDRPQWRQIPNPGEADTFEVYRRFAPGAAVPPDFHRRGPPGFWPSPPMEPPAPPRGLVIFVGLDMGPIEAARKKDLEHSLWMAAILLLIGFSGVVSLYLAAGYRAARSSLSRVRAFSDSLVRHMPIGLVVVDDAGRIGSCNDQAEAILGCSSGGAMGEPAAERLPAAFLELIGKLTDRQAVIEKEANVRIGGKTIPMEIIAATLREDRGDSQGKIVLFRDTSEVRRLQEEVERTRRLASLGSLAAGVAHEIRNPLSSIKGFAIYFKERYRQNAEDGQIADVMVKEVERLNRVIGQLLEFSRPVSVQRRDAALPDLVRHALKVIEPDAAKAGVEIRTEFAPGLPTVRIDPDRFHQVLLNLLLNAIQAMEGGGTLTLSVAPDGDGRMRIAVSDTGKGIAPENLDRIFDPYFTTRPAGTGLGMAIVQRIVEAHGGEIRVESTPGRGTTVLVFLPPRERTL